MNQKQRELVAGIIKSNVAERIRELQKKRVNRPSLNNYLVHAILSGEITFQDPSVLAAAVKERTLSLSGDQTIISNKDAFGYSRNTVRDDRFSNGVLLVPVESIFVLPPEYLRQVEIVENYNDKIDEAIDALRAYGEKLNLKIMIGSEKALETLIDEADNLADLSLMKNVIGEMPRLSLSGKAQQALLNAGDKIEL